MGLICEDPLKEEMATQSSILVWEIPSTEEPGRLQFLGLETQMQQHEYLQEDDTPSMP